MGYVLGFLPWIVYWILVGNVAFRTALLVALAVAALAVVVGRLRHERPKTLDVGSVVVFVLLTAVAFVVPDTVLERWIQPLGNAGLLLIVLAGLALRRPFVLDYATASVDAVTARTDGFRAITTAMTWLWAGLFAAMTVLSAIPPVVDGDATLLDADDTLSILCYWVAPFALMGIGGVISGAFPPWFSARSTEVDRRSAGAPAVVPQPAPAPDVTEGLVIEAPADSRHDEPFDVVVRGATQEVELTAEGVDLVGRPWRATAAFPAADALDLAATAPTSGDWDAADPAAPLWAMRFGAEGAVPDLFVPPVDPWRVTLTARSGTRSARRTATRRTAADGVEPTSVDVGGLRGTLVLPPGGGSGLPAVACFGGSEGGSDSQFAHAALLASRGFVALAAPWIPEPQGAGSIGEAIEEVPLERFATALDLLAGHAAVDRSRVAAMAVSRGSEGLLAAAAAGLGPRLSALVLVSPSSVTWQAVGGGGEVPDTASWARGGTPLPWQPLPSGALMPQIVRNDWSVRRDTAAHRPSLLRLRPAYEAGLARGVGAAAIPSERVPCPILCVSGDDDQLWPSGPMADALLARRHRDDDQHLHYRGAGHLIRLGTFPTDAPWTGGIAFGGTRAGLAAAQRDVTERVPAFLQRRTAVTPATT
ncbi:acyl-CoA thioester hydrolase/bile acid acetyltransferase-like protein [Actinomycetospora cinnamomea]|uniref:Acyl-CoA thioester hydrolase/bile acid acetyltransferase-like protein n=2 Tax=Actinomycetospora cinnamomea TaxID=663609 RepID=A0A2U1F6Y8_9PSEU|nr:acyl-CoA thioester hydrolase/bile acid acetyltransferase-like protein [Actinomycetospora cinnamomea]